MTTPKSKFILHLEATPRGTDDSGMLRLRALLKVLWRSFGFRCVDIQCSNTNEQENPEQSHENNS